VEREDVISDENIEEELSHWLKKLAGNELKVYLLPRAPEDVPDTKELKLALLASIGTGERAAIEPFIRELLEKSGTAFRVYRNTVLALAPALDELLDLRRQIKRYLALRSIRDDKPLMRQLSEENKKTLEDKLRDAEGRIPFQLLSAYRHLAKAGAGEEGVGIEWFDLGLPTVGERSTIAKRVRDYLKSQELLLERIAPRQVLQKALGEEETEKPLKEIYEAFLKYPHLPLLEGERVLHQAIVQGVRDGLFGLRIGERVYFREPVPTFTLEEAVLVRQEIIEKPKEEGAEMEARERGREGEAEAERISVKEGTKETIPTPAAEVVGARSVTLRVRIPWDKMADFLRGVLMPLHQDGADLQIEVLLQAHSEEGIQKRTLEEKVKETLKQINAEVEEERIEG